MIQILQTRMTRWALHLRKAAPGLALTVGVTVLAVLAARLTAVPAVIMALLAGLLLNPVIVRKPLWQGGIDLAADPLMKIGVACLGAGINLAVLATLGWPVFLALIGAMFITLLSGLLIGRALGQSRGFSILSAGAVAICGASAALAIRCALPKDEIDARELSVVIIAVSLLSAAGIVLYPLLTSAFSMNDVAAGFVTGGALHNVAQAIAAGFAVSDAAGETATIVKMSRVAMLAPLVMLVSVMFARGTADIGSPRRGLARPPLFLIGFLVLMGASGLGLLPGSVKDMLAATSKAGLLMAMTAIGLQTSVSALIKIDRRKMILLTAETAVLLAVILCAAHIIPL